MLLVLDASLSVCDGLLLICAIDGEYRIKRYRTHPQPHLANLENGRMGEWENGRRGAHHIDDGLRYLK